MITIKLSSSNYLLWKSQLLPLLESQDLLAYVDGTLVPPPPDQRLLCLLLSSLTEEAIAVVVGLSTAREVWLALENTFSHHSKARELRLKDDLQLMKRGTKPVAEYARTFKTLCDQLHAIGRPVEDTDKVHWFLHLVSKAESFELFQRSLESSEPTTAAFTATNRSRTTSHGTPFAFRNNQRGRSHSHNNNSSNRGRTYSGHGRRPPRCQICRIEGHYADRCNQRYARTDSSAHLAEAFNTSCSLSGPEAADWFLDTGASAHMTTDPSILDQSKNYMGKDSVIVGNGASLPITHTESSNRKGGGDRSLTYFWHTSSTLLSIYTCSNGRAERKHRHVTETGLALLFHSHLSPRFWVDAFSTATYIINRLPTPLLGGSSLPPLASSPHSIEHAADSSSSLGSHPMITRAKAGIFKTRYPANLGVLGLLWTSFCSSCIH
ncbi:Retrovirus-related Pol polyprotein from transposon RE1 [Vitis vinifera]|uniref:Retrovirus-related Pol polyprotein from transposon RE1 n=1 Tax=Vitis vinifera TaxID=29760 RepID=A0A438EZ78_VITVI|nr:Retrovirus-related Pol polyprotein from transposon RE1 [Vitis vinifera]